MSTGTTASNARPRKRTSAPAPDRKTTKPARADGRVKSTLLLAENLDFRLTTIAASLKTDRSQLAAQLLDAGLRRYALDDALRRFAGAPGSTLPVREDRPDTAAQ